jgi:hypothetical protein
MSFAFYKRYIIGLLLFFVLLPQVKAQASWEIGVKAGTTFYLGDKNSSLFNEFNPIYGGFMRINSNYRWVTKVQFATGAINLQSDATQRVLKQRYVDFSVQEEFNFFEYGMLNSSSWTRFFSPYIFFGIGLGSYTEGNYTIFSPNIPFGIGVKYKVLPRINIGLEWSMHKLFSDAFDGVNNPYNNKEFGWTNKDWYSMATFMLSVDIGNKSSYCR